MTTTTTASCAVCKTAFPPDPTAAHGPWTTWHLPLDDDHYVMQRVCEACFEHHYRRYEIATYCPKCGANAKAFRRYEWRDIVIGCFRCDCKLQVIPDLDCMNLPEDKREQIQRLFFDFWEGR